MRKELKLLPPEMPNYVRYGTEEGDSVQIVVSEITESQAIEFAELMKATFLKHYNKLKGSTWHKAMYKPK